MLESFARIKMSHSAAESSASIQRIMQSLENPLFRLLLLFLSDALPVINIFNKMMQQQAPALHVLQQEVHSFIKKLILCFMDPSVLEMPLNDVNVDGTGTYKPLHEVFIGERAQQHTSESDLSTAEVRNFHTICQKFWIASAVNAIKKLPVTHDLLENIDQIQPFANNFRNAAQVFTVASFFPQVIKESERPALAEEYMDYCTSELPFHRQNMAINEYWHKVSAVTDIAGDVQHPLLSKLAKAILVIPYGNVDIERMFSHLGLNKTKLQNSLSTETLSALLNFHSV